MAAYQGLVVGHGKLVLTAAHLDVMPLCQMLPEMVCVELD